MLFWFAKFMDSQVDPLFPFNLCYIVSSGLYYPLKTRHMPQHAHVCRNSGRTTYSALYIQSCLIIMNAHRK